jgi:hypothetical protein
MRYRLGGSTCISILSPRPSKQLQHAVYTLVALSGTTSAVGFWDSEGACVAASFLLKEKPPIYGMWGLRPHLARPVKVNATRSISARRGRVV